MLRINKLQVFKAIKCILYILLGIGAIITLFIVYKKVNNPFASKFALSYLFLIFLLALYLLFLNILNIRTLKWVELRKRLSKFVSWFVLYSVLSLAFDYFIRPSEIDFLRACSISFGLSYGMSFSDLMFSKTKRKELNE